MPKSSPKKPTTPPLSPTNLSTPSHPGKTKVVPERKGATSNYYLHKFLQIGPDKLDEAERKELAKVIRETHRITPVSTKKANSGKTVFNSVTGHHEWLPTDRAEQIIQSGPVWSLLYTTLRSPTWLLVVNPERYCTIERNDYINAVQAAAAGFALSNSTQKVKASTLGLVGHSGGLNYQDVPLTKFQSEWHDELRKLYEKHCKANGYDAYFLELQDFLKTHFLFYDSTALPLLGANVNGVSGDDLMKYIEWDLGLSGRGNPQGMATLYDVAQFLRSEWSTWSQVLVNSFHACRGTAPVIQPTQPATQPQAMDTS